MHAYKTNLLASIQYVYFALLDTTYRRYKTNYKRNKHYIYNTTPFNTRQTLPIHIQTIHIYKLKSIIHNIHSIHTHVQLTNTEHKHTCKHAYTNTFLI